MDREELVGVEPDIGVLPPGPIRDRSELIEREFVAVLRLRDFQLIPNPPPASLLRVFASSGS